MPIVIECDKPAYRNVSPEGRGPGRGEKNRTNNLTLGMCDDLSHCKLALAFAVLMDLLGGVSLLVGVFVSLEIKGQEFGDFLVYSGVLLVVASLAGWVLWYSGNIEGLSPEKELGQISSAVDRIARRLSRKIFSHRKHLNYSQSSCV
ncbi:hypothetical protein AMECASPLE_021749 [Ameca splendens]|uniref:Transmembrane protein 238 n=1 Tax=Ameca splendens TaxID=208324 RepID=A0ABV1AB16_9TELE